MVLSLLVSLLLFSIAAEPIIETSYGRIRGYSTVSKDGQAINVFKGVPYAAPPVGELRWKLPQAHSKWTQTWNATYYRPACWGISALHIFTSGEKREMSEDCIYMNIFASSKCLTSKCPIAVFFHGGDMVSGSAASFDDSRIIENFASKDIMLVIPGFRLGFAHSINFNDNHDIVPSNLGLHDALLALRFLKTEGASFGGNVDDVTLWGQSYGSTLALALSYSPVVQREFKISKIIAMSPYARFRSEEDTLMKTNKLINMTNCGRSTVEETIDCMMLIDAKDLNEHQLMIEFRDPLFTSFGGFSLTPPLLPYNSRKEMLMHPPQSDLLIGATKHEMDGIPVIHWGEVGRFLEFENPVQVDEAYYAMKDSRLLKDPHTSDSNTMFMSAHKFAESIGIKNKVYMYSYDHAPKTFHGDDLLFLLGIPANQDTQEDMMSMVLPPLFSSFIKNGAPVAYWTEWNHDHRSFCSIAINTTDGRFPEMRMNFNEETVNFFTDVAPAIDDLISKARNG